MAPNYTEKPGQPSKNTYLITLKESYTRDIQTLPGDVFVPEGGEYEDAEFCWEDYNDGRAGLVLGEVTAGNEAAALIDGGGKWGYNPKKLNAYKLASD